MYQKNEELTQYFAETDAKKRRVLLDGALSSFEEASFLKMLFDARYKEEKNGDLSDRFLLQCIELPYLYKNQSLLSFFPERRFKTACRALYLDRYEGFPDAEKALLSREYENTARCYLKTCEGGSYRAILGMIQSDDASRANQIASDIFEMTDGIAGRFAAKEILAPWILAFQEVYFSSSDKAKALYDALPARKNA